jgi:3-methyladenine DNA glycosylase AlkD
VTAAPPLTTAADVMAALRGHGLVDPPDGRHVMRLLFETARAARELPMAEVDRLMAEPSYAARMAAFSVLDAQARRRPGDPALRDAYLRHHDRIDAWGMVDRAAPWCVGAAVAGGPYGLLHELAASVDPLRRRTAMTAPLWFARHGSPDDVEAGFALAEVLHADADPLVHKPVGIYLAHAGDRDRERLLAFLDAHEAAMARPAARLARRKLAAAGS